MDANFSYRNFLIIVKIRGHLSCRGGRLPLPAPLHLVHGLVRALAEGEDSAGLLDDVERSLPGWRSFRRKWETT